MREWTAPFVGRVYRAHHPMWAYQPESGAGAALHGGRFNRPGVECLYTSLSPETAWLEAQQAFPFKAQPMTLCAYAVNCADVLDLTDERIRRGVSVPLERLACAWEDEAATGREPETWVFADDAREADVAAVIVPSFASRASTTDRNLVFWQWSRGDPCRLRVIDDFDRLPVDRSSWRQE